MKEHLVMGKAGEKEFTLPLEAVAQTFAFLGIRGSGKTSSAIVMAEEMCRAGQPWIAIDPVSVWWGMRAKPNGKPSDFPVVVFGGMKGDLPIDKNAGKKIAEAVIAEQVFAVIDLSQESKATWRKFVTEFSLALMDMNPSAPRHIFIEEAPEFIPQRTKVAITAQCKEAVERLVRLGRNRGYGASLISQRPATVDKDALSQCENLFVLRTVGAHDRKALKEWLGEKQVGDESFLTKLDSLGNGEGFFWSPAWQRRFEHIQIRPRETFHPGATRKVGTEIKAVTMADVKTFVEKVKRQFSKKVVPVEKPKYESMEDIAVEQMAGPPKTPEPVVNLDDYMSKKKHEEIVRGHLLAKANVESKLSAANDAIYRLTKKFDAIKRTLGPQYEMMKTVFANLEEVVPSEPVNGEVYKPWLEKAGGGTRRKMLEVVLDRKEVTRAQLSTLSGCSIRSSGFKNNLSWMRVNRLIDTEGETVKLMSV